MLYSETRDIVRQPYICEGDDGEYIINDVTKVHFNPDLERIKTKAFSWCFNIMSLIIPNFVITIETAAFFGCKFIETLQLSSSLETIQNDAFCGCSSLKELPLPSSVHTLGKSAFEHCASIRNITIQKCENELSSLQKIGDGGFRNCISLEDFPYLPNLQTLGQRAFGGCISLTEVTLGPSVMFAARNAFDGCVSLQTLKCTYREGIILPWAITDVVVEPNTTKIHNSAFAGCIFLRNINLTLLIENIGKSAFWGCESLHKNFRVPDTVKAMGIGAFGRCSSTIKRLKLPFHATQDVYTFMGSGDQAPLDIRNVLIDETVKEISTGTFDGCSELTELMIPPTVLTIKTNAFGRCSSLQKVTCHDSATMTIESHAFQHCEGLRIFNVPEVVMWVLDGEFGKNTSPKKRPSLPEIDQHAFGHCSTQIMETCARYNVLRQFWVWILEKEKEYINTNTIFFGAGSEKTKSGFLDAKSMFLDTGDLEIVQRVFSTQSKASDDLLFTILKYLQGRDADMRNSTNHLRRRIVSFS